MKEPSDNKKEILSFMTQKFDDMKKTFQEENSILRAQIKVVVDSLADQKVMICQILREQAEELPLRLNFPINSEEDLAKINEEINQINRDSYIKTMRIILQPAGVLKSMKCILTDRLMMGFNVDGVQGKKSLKIFQNFYGVLLESIPISDTSGSAEMQIREAIKLQKKRLFKSISIKRK
ncbi:uncharacterized protein LOC129237322 [Anastrepha obliqua]|uniref:uncharacterized protein LOC129237322 n=1 Tax=Anastrepha obliqua TaxID=95512 RepID=UPI00240A6CE0|nr:uncharacterized protein LOC129237322 [Anastrepha obliqua]